jgi:hypothetical protein
VIISAPPDSPSHRRPKAVDFIDQLKALAGKIPALCDILLTEEATKTALVMPFIRTLGYDIFDPTEVVPEFIADFAVKKGEKVDYAVKKDGKIIMLFECKHCGGDLNVKHAGQLFRYFSVTDARIGVLTNGIVYRFFTDLEAQNKMDDKPFLEVDMLDLNETVVDELKKLTKPAFNVDELMTAAGDLKYTREIKRLLAEQMENPSDEFVRFCATKVFTGPLTPNRREYFARITKQSFYQLLNDGINYRLKSAIAGPSHDESEEEEGGEGYVVTTEEELEGYHIIKAILRKKVDPARIAHRDTQSYMGILLDDNNRKPIARLHFNRKQKYIGVFDEKRKEERIPIETVDDIYKLEDKLKRVLAVYEKEKIEGEGGENEQHEGEVEK